MSYHLSIDRTAEIADSAFSHMRENQVPPTPENFAIWFEYAAGFNPPLAKTLDKLIDSDKKFDEETSRKIYQKHVGPGSSNAAADSQVEAIAGQMLDALKQAGEDTGHYEERLQSFSGTLDNTDDDTEFRKLVDDMVAETKSMSTHTNVLQDKLAESADEITKLRDELEFARQDAMTDALTGLANRRCFDRKLEQAVETALEDDAPLALIMADLDHFKDFNDKFGHTVGDQVLRIVGNALTQRVKGADTAARYGGEEFAIVFPAKDRDHAYGHLEVLRKTIEETEFTVRQLVRRRRQSEATKTKKTTKRKTTVKLSVTVSIGVAERSEKNPTD